MRGCSFRPCSALALLTFAGWLWHTGRPAEALMHAIAVLVIACPCALGIATPLALTAAVAAASRRGILVTDARVLETICKVDVVALDKTGTATSGEFALLETSGDTSRMAELAAVEACSEHPLAKAMGQIPNLPRLNALDVLFHPSMGISGVVGATRYFIGSERLFDQSRDRKGAETRSTQTDLEQTGWQAEAPAPQEHTKVGQTLSSVNPGGRTVVWFGWDGAIKGSLTFGDRIRPDAAALCADLRKRGVRTMLLSGDSPAPTAFTARAIGADDWTAEATPARKVEIIADLQRRGLVVAMVGDGVNDAPSLAKADLGIALGSGADIAMQAAPLVIMGNSLEAVTQTLDLARRTFRVVRQNLYWAFGYNVAGITLAVSGVLSPIFAAAAMVLSSLSVIGNSRRLG